MTSIKTILDLSNVKAFQYFMEPESFCSLELPKYISFKPILEYVKKVVSNNTLTSITKDKQMPSEFYGVNHKILIKKDPKYTFRPIQISNPYLYYLLVKEMTSKSRWEEIKKRFKTFSQPQIEVSSIPVIKKRKDKSNKSASVSNWWEKIEQRSIALSLHYKYLFVTDITNCYGSIYTHSIAWAMMGKDEAKKSKSNKGLLGNIIDHYIQGMQHGQTNGIPQGSALYDFIAEMVLGYADTELVARLKEIGIYEYKILRYRDDYKVFSNNKDEIDKIAFVLQEVLAELNFQLNSPKTIMTEEIVQSSIKPDKIAYIQGCPLYKTKKGRVYAAASSLQQEALYIHQFAKKFPDSGTLMKLLSIFSKRLTESKTPISESHTEVLISIFVEIAQCSPKAYKLLLHLISFLIEKLPTTNKREETARAVYEKFNGIPNTGELQIWMQHITYQMINGVRYTEPICRIVADESNITLWNIDWVKDEFKKDFPQHKICTNWLRDSFTPIIDIDEVSLFEVY